MKSWEGMHDLTLPEYMQHAEETYMTPKVCFQVLDSNADGNSTREEFRFGSNTFKRPPFRYPAEIIPIFDAIDMNQDGVIQDEEFYKSTPSSMDFKWHINMTDLKLRAKQGYGMLDSYFSQMDLDANGKVTEQEWMDAAKLLSPPVQ